MRDIEESTVLVTGGGRGIGRATCLEFAEAGATVYTCSRTPADLDELVGIFEGRGALVAQTADVTRPAEIDALMDRIRSEEEGLDVLINNAGILGPRESIESIDLEDWRRTLEANLDGVFVVSRAAIPLLRRAEEGLIVNVSSSVGREGRGGWGPYAVSKHGVEGLTGTLADELRGAGVTVVSANPGGTATEMRAEAYPDEDSEDLPSPGRVAATFRLVAETVGLERTGERFDCRDLFEFTGRENAPDGSELPGAND